MCQLFARLSLVLLFAHAPGLLAQDCPDELLTLTNWFASSPEFSGAGDISMVATFTNISGESFEFEGDEVVQMWTTPSIFEFVPIEYNARPTGTVLNGQTLTYDLTIHAGAFLPSESGFAFRGNEPTRGNLGPASIQLESATFSCTKGTGFQMDQVMTASFSDPGFLGQGINLEILTEPEVIVKPGKGDDEDLEGIAGVVLMYWYSFDLLGFPIFTFGVGEYTGDTMIVDMLIDYDGAGPFFGPGWDPDDFTGTPFATVRIIWSDCVDGLMTAVIDPAFEAMTPGFVTHSMDLTRITNVLGLPCS